MAELDDLQKVMLRIEQLLKNSSQATGGRPSVAGGRARDQSDRNDTKTFRARSVGLETLNTAAGGAAQSLNSLSKTVQSTRANFVAMNRTMRATSRTPIGTTDVKQANPDDVVKAKVKEVDPKILVTPNAAQRVINAIFGSSTGPDGPVQKSVNDLATGISTGKVGFVTAMGALSGAIRPVINDLFKLSSSGIAAYGSIGGLYKDAALAGMSLEEYTKVLQDSGPVVARSSNFDDFNKMLSTTGSKLGDFGIFGSTATKLAGEMVTEATTLGISRDQVSKAVDGQIAVFSNLRKSTMVTADTMEELAKDVANNHAVQEEFLGLTKPEREARLAELTSVRALGLQMGMTKSASKELGDALLATRNMTAVDRFGAAGNIRQGGAILGMDSGDTEALASVALKKNKSAEDVKTFADLGGQYMRGIEQMQNSDNIQQQNTADEMMKNLGSSGILDAMKKAGIGGLAKDAGPVDGVNAKFSEGTDKLLQGAGEWLKIAEGLSKNPIAAAISSAIGSAAFATGISAAIGGSMPMLLGKWMGKGGAAAATGAGEVAAGTVAAGAGEVAAGTVAAGATAGEAVAAGTVVAKTVATGFARFFAILGPIVETVQGVWNAVNATSDNPNNKAAADKQRGEGIGQAAGAVIGGLLGAIFGPLGIALGGMLGGWAGKWIGGLISSSKDQTEETKKNTEVLTKVNELKDAPTEVLSSPDNLAGVAMRTGKTYMDAEKADKEKADKAAEVKSKTDAVQAAADKELMKKNLVDNMYESGMSQSDLDKEFAKIDAAFAATPTPAATTAIATQAGTNAAQAVVATPGPTPRSEVTPPTLNTAPDTTTQAGSTTPAANTPAAITTPDLTTTLATIISLLQQSVAAETLQSTLFEAMSRSTGRPQFVNTTDIFNNTVAFG